MILLENDLGGFRRGTASSLRYGCRSVGVQPQFSKVRFNVDSLLLHIVLGYYQVCGMWNPQDLPLSR